MIVSIDGLGVPVSARNESSSYFELEYVESEGGDPEKWISPPPVGFPFSFFPFV